MKVTRTKPGNTTGISKRIAQISADYFGRLSCACALIRRSYATLSDLQHQLTDPGRGRAVSSLEHLVRINLGRITDVRVIQKVLDTQKKLEGQCSLR